MKKEGVGDKVGESCTVPSKVQRYVHIPTRLWKGNETYKEERKADCCCSSFSLQAHVLCTKTLNETRMPHLEGPMREQGDQEAYGKHCDAGLFCLGIFSLVWNELSKNKTIQNQQWNGRTKAIWCHAQMYCTCTRSFGHGRWMGSTLLVNLLFELMRSILHPRQYFIKDRRNKPSFINQLKIKSKTKRKWTL